MRLFGVAAALWLSVGCDDDATAVCERLNVCGCLSESVESCAERIEDSDDVGLCAHCIEYHDFMCHEMAANHGACRGCTDRYASADRARLASEDGRDANAEQPVSCVPRSSVSQPMPTAGASGGGAGMSGAAGMGATAGGGAAGMGTAATGSGM